MTKRFDEEVRVERDAGLPAAFEWRGRRYEVADVIGKWRIEGRWWADGRDRVVGLLAAHGSVHSRLVRWTQGADLQTYTPLSTSLEEPMASLIAPVSGGVVTSNGVALQSVLVDNPLAPSSRQMMTAPPGQEEQRANQVRES